MAVAVEEWHQVQHSATKVGLKIAWVVEEVVWSLVLEAEEEVLQVWALVVEAVVSGHLQYYPEPAHN